MQVPEVKTLESFRFAAALLRDLSDAWRLANADPALTASAHRWQLDYPVDEDFKLNRFFAVQLLADGLPPLLARFHPYVLMPPASFNDEPEKETEPLDEEAPRQGVLLKAASSLAFVHLAEFCALELYNHIARRRGIPTVRKRELPPSFRASVRPRRAPPDKARRRHVLQLPLRAGNSSAHVSAAEEG